jgi:dimethylhistidine N-methyltransferase
MDMLIADRREARDVNEPSTSFARDVLGGLAQRQKRLSPKYFYDAQGSDLFEQITQLPEYYPTRSELAILQARANEIAAFIPQQAVLVEFGAGAFTKARIVLGAADVAAYLPVDISAEFLNAQARALRFDFPRLDVHPIAADFTAPFVLPDAIRQLPKVGFFPGSTLGNFEPDDAVRFLRNIRQILGDGARLLIGLDLEKDERLLIQAYDDSAGVTARFNLNLLARINRELGADFDLRGFAHRALYNDAQHRIEMHLVSRAPQSVRLLGHRFSFRAGETIHTENSYKFSIARFRAIALSAGWTVQASWTDAAALFSVHALAASG